VDETPRLAEHYAGRKYVFDVIENMEEACPTSPGENMGLDGIVAIKNNLHFLLGSHDKSLITHARSEVPRYLEANPQGSALVYCLESKVKGPLIPLRLVGSFFDFIPARIGRNAALDAAVSCLCTLYCGMPSAPYHSNRSIYQSYVRALSSLRCCLNDASFRTESETLCASILLHMCEVSFSMNPNESQWRLSTNHLFKLVVNIDRGGWGELARGTAFLLHSRGVNRYTSAFDHSMLESQMGFVVSDAHTMHFVL
jgi:hypothetical protein